MNRKISGSRQFLAFLMVGATSAILTIILRAALMHILPFEPSVGIAHVFGLTVAFTLNRFLVFASYEGSLVEAYYRFFLVNIISLAIATGVSSVFYRSVLPAIGVQSFSDYIAHFSGLAASAIPSYFGHRYFSFGISPRR